MIKDSFYKDKHVEHKGELAESFTGVLPCSKIQANMTLRLTPDCFWAGAVDLVTETDKKCEELVLGTIRKNFPDHNFIGEEGSAAQASSDQLIEVIMRSQRMNVTLMAFPKCRSNAKYLLHALTD